MAIQPTLIGGNRRPLSTWPVRMGITRRHPQWRRPHQQRRRPRLLFPRTVKCHRSMRWPVSTSLPIPLEGVAANLTVPLIRSMNVMPLHWYPASPRRAVGTGIMRNATPRASLASPTDVYVHDILAVRRWLGKSNRDNGSSERQQVGATSAKPSTARRETTTPGHNDAFCDQPITSVGHPRH